MAVWQNGRMRELPGLGGRESWASAINNRGQVAGYSKTKARDSHAVLWQNGKVIDVGTLGGAWSYAEAINDRGEIVGSSDTRSGQEHAVLWTRRNG